MKEVWDLKDLTIHDVQPATNKPMRGPSWGHPRVNLETIGSFLEPFCGHISPNIDKVS